MAADTVIGSQLLKRALVNEQQLGAALADQEVRPRPIGTILVERGAVAEDAVRDVLFWQIANTLVAAKLESVGTFVFVIDTEPQRVDFITVDTHSVLLKVHLRPRGRVLSRRRDAGQPSTVLVRNGDYNTLPRNPLPMGRDEFAVLLQVDGQRTVKEITQASRLKEITVVSILGKLADAGVLLVKAERQSRAEDAAELQAHRDSVWSEVSQLLNDMVDPEDAADGPAGGPGRPASRFSEAPPAPAERRGAGAPAWRGNDEGAGGPKAAHPFLLLTAGAASVAVRAAARSLTRSQAVGVGMAARRALRMAGGLDAEALEEALADLRSEGVTYLGVVAPDGSVAISAGEPAPVSAWLPAERAAGLHAQPSRTGFGVRLQSPLGEGPGRGGMGAGRFGRGLWHGGDPQGPGPGAGPGSGPGHGPWQALRAHRLVIELESDGAHSLAARARLTLLADLVAAALLLGLTGVFWRLSRQAEETSAQLARDSQLKALGEMSALLGHELRNPLASLKGHVQLLLEKLPADHPGRRGAETVLRETVRLENLSRQVLEFARTGSVEPADEDPVALARAAADSVGDPRVRIAVTGETQSWPLDRARMEEVLVNLLRNAVEASPDGKPIDLMVAIRPATS